MADTTKKGFELIQELLKLVGGTFGGNVLTDGNFSVCDDTLEVTDSMNRPMYWIERGEKEQEFKTFAKTITRNVPVYTLSIAEYDGGDRDTPPDYFDRELGAAGNEQALVTLILQQEASNIINGAMESAGYKLYPDSMF